MRNKKLLLAPIVLLLLAALSACGAGTKKTEAAQPPPPSAASSAEIAPQPVNNYPFTLIGEESDKLSAQDAANLGGAWALELCGMNLAKDRVELAYEPEYDRAFFSDGAIANYKGRIKTENEYLEYNIDAQTGFLYDIEHGPYDEATGLGSAEHTLTQEERQEALQKLTAFFERQGRKFTLTHMEWGKFYVVFQDGGGLFVWYDKYPTGIFVSELVISPSSDMPYPKTTPSLNFQEDSYPLKGVNGLDDQGDWALTPREAFQTAAKAAKAICGIDFYQMEAYSFGNRRDPENPEFYGTCVFSDGTTAIPKHLRYASDAVSSGYYEATWSVDAQTGQLLHLYVRQAHTGFPTEAFQEVALQKATEVCNALGIQGELHIIKIGDCAVTVADPKAPNHEYELWFSDTEGYAFRNLYYQ